MPRLIDADAIQAQLERKEAGIANQRYTEGWNDCMMHVKSMVSKAPTIYAVPVVYGRWENGNPICPVCGEDKFKDLDADIWSDWRPDYCPNCGAKMGGESI